MASFSNVYHLRLRNPVWYAASMYQGWGLTQLSVLGLHCYPHTLLPFPESFPALRVEGWGMGDSCPYQLLSAALQAASETYLLTLC